MARVKIDLPRSFPFSTELAVRITDINYGAHLGNDTMLTLLHEARVQFFAHYGLKELDSDGMGIAVADTAVVYKTEVFYGDVLRIEVAVADIRGVGCDLVYRVTKVASGEPAAEAKAGIVFYDYKKRKIREVPPEFLSLFGAGK